MVLKKVGKKSENFEILWLCQVSLIKMAFNLVDEKWVDIWAIRFLSKRLFMSIEKRFSEHKSKRGIGCNSIYIVLFRIVHT